MVDELLASQAKIQSKTFQIFFTNHTISIPFRIIGTGLTNGNFRRDQRETITRVDIFNIKRIGDAYTVLHRNLMYYFCFNKKIFFIV